jgi:RNA polymerase sigma-70 factor (ECF subfamily)
MTVAASREGVFRVMWVLSPAKIAAFLDSRSRCATPH